MAQAPSWVITQFGVTEDSIKAIGNKVQITMDKAYPPSLVLSCMTYSVTGTVNPKVAEEHNVDGDMGMAYLTENSVGSGPYKLVSWDRNQKLIFEVNENYWGFKPEINKIVIIDIPELSSQLLQLKGGTIDVAWNLENDQIPDIKKTEGVHAFSKPQFKLIYFAMNGKTPPTDNVLVRRAVKDAIDTQAIMKAIGGGIIELHTFTHDLYLARIITKKIAVMYQGKIMEHGDMGRIFKNPLHPYTEALFSVIPKLDPQKRTKKIILKGEIPSPVDPPLGCRFHTRCSKKIGEICEKVSPYLKEIEEKHFVSCHLYG